MTDTLIRIILGYINHKEGIMDKVEQDISDTLHKAEMLKIIFWLIVLLIIGYFLAGPLLTALERNDYPRQNVKVVEI